MISTASASPPPLFQYLHPLETLEKIIPSNAIQSDVFKSLPVIALTVILGGGFLFMVANKYQQAKVYSGVIALVMFIGVIAVTQKMATAPTSTQINAGPDIVPQDVTFHQPDPGSLMVTWHTQTPVIGGLRVSADASQPAQVISLFDQTPTTDHLFRLPEVTPGTTYYVAVLSDSRWFHQSPDSLLKYTVPGK